TRQRGPAGIRTRWVFRSLKDSEIIVTQVRKKTKAEGSRRGDSIEHESRCIGCRPECFGFATLLVERLASLGKFKTGDYKMTIQDLHALVERRRSIRGYDES